MSGREVRSDIQGLRALAVLLVIGFHLYPDRLVGGFVGVDVFFVISGFLITGHLLRSPPRRAVDFADFWGRRVRRLLPASLLVIVVTVLAATLMLPVTQLAALGRDALASALYVENWNLADQSINYLSIGAAASPLQHYWSLGVEEQFYLLWPFLVALATALTVRGGHPLRTTALTLGALVASSFAVSIVWTAVQPSAAYFVTPTRLWELGIGGLVAVGTRYGLLGAADPIAHAGVRAIAGWFGLSLIILSTFVLNGTSAFPGYVALLPVGGAAIFLAARTDGVTLSPSRVLSWRPAQFVGDTSYSLYLWHFPLIILVGALIGGPLTIVYKAVILLASLVLAALTKRFVEDPVRTGSWLRRSRQRTFVVAVFATALVVGVSLVPGMQVAALNARATAERQAILTENAGCLGAAALVTDGCSIRGTGVLPSPAQAPQDVSTAYADGCLVDKPFAHVKTCVYGDPKTAKYNIALVGNSHAVEWLPALQKIAKAGEMAITTFVASGCPPTRAHVLFDTQLSSDGCRTWGESVVRLTSSRKFDLVVTSDASNSGVENVKPADKFQPQVDGYAGTLQQWADAGQKVLVIHDTPIPGFDIPSCVAQHLDKLSACSGPRSTWVLPDPLVAAANKVNSPNIRTIDLNNHFCSSTTCFGVIGGVLVYFDFMHAGATFVGTAAPYLAPEIDKLLGRTS